MNRKTVSLLIVLLLAGFILAQPVLATQQYAVIQAQKDLQKLGYYTGRVDGIVGPLTQKAVLQYQYEMELPISGRLDEITIKQLRRLSMILNTQDFAPFHYKTSRKGEAYGPVPQIVKTVCRAAGINCRIVLYDSWRLAQEDVKAGKADGMFVIAWNSARAQWLHRSTAIIETEYGLFVRADDDLQFELGSDRPSDLDGYTVGVYGPSGTSTSLKKLKTALESRGSKIFINLEPDDKPLFQKLSVSRGKYAVYSNRIVGETIIRGMGLNNTRYSGMHRGLSYYVGFSKQRVPLWVVKRFDAAYQQLVNQGAIMTILANHSMPAKADSRQVQEVAPPMARPNPISPDRFKRQDVNGDSVVIDGKSCLMWQHSGSQQHGNWDEAVAYVDKLNQENFGGFSDWRLPEIDELKTLIERDLQKQNRMYINPIFDAFQQACWSADKTESGIQFVDFFDGAMGSKDQNDTNFVRAVRTANCAKP